MKAQTGKHYAFSQFATADVSRFKGLPHVWMKRQIPSAYSPAHNMSQCESAKVDADLRRLASGREALIVQYCTERSSSSKLAVMGGKIQNKGAPRDRRQAVGSLGQIQISLLKWTMFPNRKYMTLQIARKVYA